ncbi:DNA-3-methyladenine glycosylase 2 [Sciscionella sediminilitoris]|uniref:DNA-3-methyladenine glycosylase 2 n=1 Tax=Sciscionella sediminilitoris TaxID=1445613 RepID=UPI0009EC8D77|nr:DNA-3-methyladenine glycosylase 2 [Sciscionella sp. SE31]
MTTGMAVTGTATMTGIWAQPDRAYRIAQAKDSRFDGWFIVAVRTTGIYCRPSCPARTPNRENTQFFPTAAAAQNAGFRACRRCLPDALPGSPEWDLRADLAGRAMRLIADGVIEREGVAGLASRLGYSQRHVTRVLTEELGAGPLSLARAHRAHAARLLIETTALSFSDIAFASGFASVRQFNDTIGAVYAATPSRLRSARHRRVADTQGRLAVRLPVRAPMDSAGVLGFLATRAIPGVEELTEDGYARTLRLPHGPAVVRLRFEDGSGGRAAVHCSFSLTDVRDLATAVTRVRRLLDLDADPVAVDEVLGADPALRDSVTASPGIRVPGAVDAAELIVRAVLGQQVSVAAARTALGRLCAELGDRITEPDGTLRTLFPTAEVLAERGGEVLRGPRRRVETVVGAMRALADGSLGAHLGRDPAELRADLEALPGIGPWTAGYVVLRLLGAPDVLLTGDLALRKGAEALGLPDTVNGLLRHANRWRPWGSYAGMHLWRAAHLASAERAPARSA